MTLFRTILALAACALGLTANASAASLDLRVRAALPPEIRTIQQAISYYLEPAGYSFSPQDPTYGDFSDLAARRVVRTAPDGQPLPIRDAILAVLPDSVVLYVDTEAQRVVLGRRPATANDARDRVHVMTPVAATSEPEPVPEPPVASSQLPDVIMDPEPATADIGVAAEAAPLASEGFFLPLVAGETLSLQLTRLAPEGYQVVWRAPNDLMVGANATIAAATFEDAVVQALRALWHTRNALIVTHYSNNVLVITAP